jgi:type II secretory pathway predicted ATPase ExeA
VTTLEQPGRLQAYEPFFGLNQAPFSLAPDTRFLFASASHSTALAQVAYALERREPLVVITGEIGTGKTLLCQTVLQGLRRKTFISVITDPLLERDDLLKQLLQDFGVISKDRTRLTDTSRHDLVEALHAFLRSLAPIHAHAVVIVDEAQHLQPDVLEQIRLVSNIDDEHGTLLQIILVGQTDLELLLARPELHQLQQRVSRRLRLEPLTGAEVQQYIEHRLALARDGKPAPEAPGATELERELADWAGTNAGVEFTPDAIRAVSELSGGLPRMINLLCDRSLEEAHASRLRIIDGPLIQTAARALGVGQQAAPATTPATVSATTTGTEVELDESFWTGSQFEPAPPDSTVHPVDEPAPAHPADEPALAHPVDEPALAHPADEPAPAVVSALLRPAAAPRSTLYLAVATSVALAGVAIWFGIVAMRPPVIEPPPLAATPASPATRGSSAPRDPAPAVVNPPVPAAAVPAAAATGGTPILKPTAPAPSAGAATATSGRFDIVVASFRTDSRATAVASAVAALGLPTRRRVSDGWQQVLSGPFASRTEAEDAQKRLNRSGLTETQIVPTAR